MESEVLSEDSRIEDDVYLNLLAEPLDPSGGGNMSSEIAATRERLTVRGCLELFVFTYSDGSDDSTWRITSRGRLALLCHQALK
jgi:hypothetical protein